MMNNSDGDGMYRGVDTGLRRSNFACPRHEAVPPRSLQCHW